MPSGAEGRKIMSDNNVTVGQQNEDMSEVIRVRREKLAELQAEGKDPFRNQMHDRMGSDPKPPVAANRSRCWQGW